VIGRPSLYSSRLADRICDAVARSVPIATACKAEGIGRRTLYDWRARGAAGESPYAELEVQLQRSLALSESALLSFVTEGAAESWRAAAWLLERRFPKRYAQRQTVRVEKAPADMTDDELEAELARLGYQRTGPALDTLTELGEIIAGEPPHTER
jgi:hypothetical protein